MTQTPTRRRRLLRFCRHLLACVLLMLVVGNVVYAHAEGSGQPGQTIVTLSWIQLEDSKGINLWQYELSINFVDDVLKAGATIASTFTQILWQGYLGCAALAIWFIDWVLSFDWLNIIIGPLTAIGESLRSVISRLGLAPAFLAIAGTTGALFVFAGKMARGVYEILIGAVIVALASTALSNPIEMVAGPDGWIYQTRDATLELIGEMGDQAETDANSITSELITTFIRQPVQVISFGQVLDGTNCETVYDDAVRTGPHGYEDTIRNAVNDCNADAGKYAENPNMGMVSSVFIQGPAGILVMLIGILIGGAVMLALVSAVLASLKAVINLTLAILPGGARRPLAQSFSDIFISLGMFVFSMFFLGVYLMVIQAVYRSSDGQPSRAFVITIIFMVLGLVAFLRYRKQLQAASNRLTDWMSKRPGGGAPKPLLPAGQGNALGKMAAVYGATKVLKNPRARQVLKTIGLAGVGAVSGNPAVLAKAAMGLAGKAKGKLTAVGAGAATGALPRTPRPIPEGHLEGQQKALRRPILVKDQLNEAAPQQPETPSSRHQAVGVKKSRSRVRGPAFGVRRQPNRPSGAKTQQPSDQEPQGTAGATGKSGKQGNAPQTRAAGALLHRNKPQPAAAKEPKGTSSTPQARQRADSQRAGRWPSPNTTTRPRPTQPRPKAEPRTQKMPSPRPTPALRHRTSRKGDR